MIESRRCINIDAEEWRLALLAVKRDILDCEPMAALRRIDALLDELLDERAS